LESKALALGAFLLESKALALGAFLLESKALALGAFLLEQVCNRRSHFSLLKKIKREKMSNTLKLKLWTPSPKAKALDSIP